MIGRHLAIASIGSLALVSACGGGDSVAPPPTMLEFNVSTTGVDLDPDGFSVAIDGQSLALPANGTQSIAATAGNHTLALSGAAFNCDFVSPPTTVNVVRSTTTSVNIGAGCTTYLHNTILYTSQEFNGAVMAMRPDGSRRVQLGFGGIYSAPAASPDGQTIAVGYGSGDGIYALDRFGYNQKLLIGGGNFDGTPAWSPDGTKLVFRRNIHTQYGDFGRIFLVNRDGSGLRQLSPDPAPTDFDQAPFDMDPSWSPDGSRVVFTRAGVLSIINVDGTGLFSTGVSGDQADWSHDGNHIVYSSINGGNTGIWVMDMSFTPHQLTTPVQSDQYPKWSPDGSQIVFNRVEGGVFQVYKMKADGSGMTKLSTSAYNDSWPNWSPSF